MLKQTLKIVSYLLGSLLIGIAVTSLADSFENVTVEEKIRNEVETDMQNAVASFKESAGRRTTRDEKHFIMKFANTVMADKDE